MNVAKIFGVVTAILIFGMARAEDRAMQASTANPPEHWSKAANQDTGPVKILSLGNWVGTPGAPNEKLSVTTDQAVTMNPANCANVGYYMINAASKVSRAMLLAAYSTKSNARFVIWGGGCLDDAAEIVHAGVVQ